MPYNNGMNNIRNVNMPMAEIIALCKRYKVKELALFGSAVTGRLRANSDIDFIVDFSPKSQVGFVALSQMQRELAALVQRKVDLVPKGGLNPLLRKEIFSSMKVLYAA